MFLPKQRGKNVIDSTVIMGKSSNSGIFAIVPVDLMDREVFITNEILE